MKRIALLFAIFIQDVFALEAVVTVLESPMLSEPDANATVVQYLRKGDYIKVHPSLNNDPNMDQYAPSQKKEAKNTYYLEDEFIPVLDRQGKTAYVMSEHIYVYFDDSRERSQNILTKDPTDYRLEEPLSEKYPLPTPSGYRGQFLFGFSQPYTESYPYESSVKSKGYEVPTELFYSIYRQAPGNYEERLFIGLGISFRYHKNTYYFYDQRISQESEYRLGLGPTISYDAYKGTKNRLNVSGTILVNLYDRLYIEQSLNNETEERIYGAYSVSPRVLIQYHRKSILPEIDFILGTSMEITPATIFQAKNAGKNASWWQSQADDKFTTRTTFALGGFIGFQAAY